MKSPLYLASLAVAGLDIDAVAVRGPFIRTRDLFSGYVSDSRGKVWLVICPLSAQTSTELEAENSVSPFLLEQIRLGKLPFDVIRPQAFTPVYPGAFKEVKDGGQALIAPAPLGHTRPWELLEVPHYRNIARAIAAIHSLDPHVIIESGMPVYTAEECRLRTLAELTDADHINPLPPALRRSWERRLEDTELWNFTPCVVHGNLNEDNVFWEGESVATITGWAHMHVGDPARDLATFVTSEDEYIDAFVQSYKHSRGSSSDSLDALIQRAQLYSELEWVRYFLYGYRNNDLAVQNQARTVINDMAAELGEDAHTPSWRIEPLTEREMAEFEEAQTRYEALSSEDVVSGDSDFYSSAPSPSGQTALTAQTASSGHSAPSAPSAQ